MTNFNPTLLCRAIVDFKCLNDEIMRLEFENSNDPYRKRALRWLDGMVPPDDQPANK